MALPTRYVNLDVARARHGAAVDRYGEALSLGDPLADAVAEALAPLPAATRTGLIDGALRDRRADDAALDALVRAAATEPAWVSPARLERGAAAIVRAGAPAGLVLGAVSLVLGYCSPAGNKPLVFTGRLAAGAPRRLAETARFVQAVLMPEGARPGGDGWRSALKVRLMHAGVRRALLRDPRWRTEDWGLPINAFDSAGTVLLFSLVLLDGLDTLGVRMRPEERADALHLWRWIGHVMGVPEGLLFADEAAARRFWDIVTLTQEPPDDDARALVHGLLNASLAPAGEDAVARLRGHAIRGLGWAVTRRALDPALLAALDPPPRDRWDAVLARLHPVNRAVSAVPWLPARRYAAGVRYWEDAVRQGLAGVPADFAMSTQLRGAPAHAAAGVVRGRGAAGAPTAR